VNKPSKFVVCVTNRAIGYWLNEKESSLIPTLRLENLANVSAVFIRAKVMKTDEE